MSSAETSIETGTEAVSFERIGRSPLYALTSRGQAAAPGYWAGYASDGPLPAVATLAEVWRDRRGVYLFCGTDPTGDPDTFLTALDRELSAGVRMLWIADPTAPAWNWLTYRLSAHAEGSGDGVTWRTTRAARFPLGGYVVGVDEGRELVLVEGGDVPGVSLTGGLTLSTPEAAFEATAGSARLPFAGAALGSWTGRLELPAAVPPKNDDTDDGTDSPARPDSLARLGVRLRYAMVDPDDPDRALVRAVEMPILRQDGANVAALLSYDPLHPLLPARTMLAFVSPESDQAADRREGAITPAGPALGSYLRTALGHPVLLTPARADAPLWSARCVFCYSPAYRNATDSYLDYYLAPDGAFVLSSPAQSGTRPDRALMLGLSGGEYVRLPADGAAVVLFQAGQPAFVTHTTDTASADAGDGSTSESSSLFDRRATTAYIAVLPTAAGMPGLTYFAQPQYSPWYAAAEGAQPGFLDSRPLPAADLPTLPAHPMSSASGQAPASPPPTLPVGVYAGVAGEAGRLARLLEVGSLAPARRAAIGIVAEKRGREDARVEAVRVVTPLGIVADVDEGTGARDTAWLRMIIASFPGEPVAELAFTRIGPRLRAALQTSELFFVVADVEEFLQQSSVRYRLDAVGLEVLRTREVPADVVAALESVVAGRLFETEEEFDEALPQEALRYKDLIRSVAGLLKVHIEGWTFQLSPRSWRTSPDSPTIMLVKYAGRSLAQWAAEPDTWGWPEAAGDRARTSGLLTDLFAAAAAAPEGSPYRRFAREVVLDPAWNGVLFLNAPVSPADLPDDLQFVTAGVEPASFYAHHVGFPLTPVEAAGGRVTLGRSAAFGLLHYEDLDDLLLDAQVPYAFKTQRLSVRFAGGAIADLSAQLELMVNRLFGDTVAMDEPQHGNNLVLAGGYQRRGGVPAYGFTLTQPCRFDTGRSALDSVEITSVALQKAAGSVASGTVAVDFVLSGSLRFAELPHFDLFSYGPQTTFAPDAQPADGYLRFSGLTVGMRFPVAAPSEQTFAADESRIALDVSGSQSRPASLAAGFPIRVTSLVAAPNTAPPGEPPAGTRPEGLGFTSVLAPLDQSRLEPPWYGLTMEVDLGSLGALAGAAGISVALLAAWAPGRAQGDRPVFLGLKTAGSAVTGTGWPVQGVLRFGFRSFEFVTTESDGRREYQLLLRRLALSILGWSLPPGETNVVLFGDPDAARPTAVGWYAAYEKSDGQGRR